MFERLFLASHGFFGGAYGGGFGGVLSAWEQAGVFSFILPFLLIFAMVFGILTQVKLFKENKIINAVIALTVGLLSLQFNFVPIFFSEIFPRLGVGLAVLLVAIILLGMFAPNRSWTTYSFFAFAVIILIVVLVKTFGWLGWQYGFFWYDYGGTIIGIGVVLVIIGVVVASSRPPSTQQDISSNFMQALFSTPHGNR